jgi:hypothetical protein
VQAGAGVGRGSDRERGKLADERKGTHTVHTNSSCFFFACNHKRSGERCRGHQGKGRKMCGILALVSLGATIDCLLGTQGRGQGGDAELPSSVDALPEEVRRLVPVLQFTTPYYYY